MLVHFSISHGGLFYKKHDGDVDIKKLDRLFQRDENLEELPSSQEYKELNELVFACGNSIDLRSESRLDTDPIYFEYYTDKGKNSLLKQVEWFKNNTSKTPLQDAFIKLLKARGVTAELKVCEIGCDELPVMKEISYLSKEEIDAKQKAEREAFKSKLTDGQREELRALAKKLKT